MNDYDDKEEILISYLNSVRGRCTFHLYSAWRSIRSTLKEGKLRRGKRIGRLKEEQIVYNILWIDFHLRLSWWPRRCVFRWCVYWIRDNTLLDDSARRRESLEVVADILVFQRVFIPHRVLARVQKLQ